MFERDERQEDVMPKENNKYIEREDTNFHEENHQQKILDKYAPKNQ